MARREGPKDAALLLPPLIILAAAVGAHWGAIDAGVVEVEDYVRMFSGSVHAGGKEWARLFSPEYFREFNSGLYRPLQSAYFYLAWLCFGSKLALYQWSKIAMLWASATLVWRLGASLLEDERWALLAALLFAAHPVHTQSLLYVGKTEDLLMVLFSLAAVWCHRRGATAWACGAFVLALMGKETALVLPGCLILSDLLDGARVKKSGRRFWAAHLLYLALAAAYLGALAWIGRDTYGAFGLALERPCWMPAARLAAHLAALWPSLGGAGPGLIAGSALAFGAMIAWDGSRRGLLFAGWIVLSLAPVLNLVSAGSLAGYLAQPPILPWRLLLPAVGFCWLAAACLQRLSCRFKALAWGLAVLWTCAHAAAARALALDQREHYADTVIGGEFLRPGERLMNARFCGVMLTLPYLRARRPETAAAVADAVSRRLPGHAGPTIVDMFSSEAIYADTRSYTHALEALSQKGFAAFHQELARLHRESGSGDAAAAFARRLGEAARLKDDGVRLFQDGRTAEAIETLERSLALNADNLYTLISLASARLANKSPLSALPPLNRALSLPGADPALRGRILGARAGAFESLGRTREARADELEAARLGASAGRTRR